MISGRAPESGGDVDLAAIAWDDGLLDALGRGGPAPEGDDLAAMLAVWRDDVGADGDDLAAILTAWRDDVGADGDDRAVAPALAEVRRARLGRRLVRIAAAVVALVVIATGLGVGSRDAGPSSPLWSLTRMLHPEQADVRLVEDAIGKARSAAAAGRTEEARDLVDEARRRLASVEDPAIARRLAAELDALHSDLIAAVPVPTPPAGSPSAAPSPTPSPSGGTGPAAPSAPPPSPGPASSPRVVVPPPDLPGLSPEPDPPSLPGLPLPTLDILD